MPENNSNTPSNPPAKRRFFSLRNLGRLLVGIAIFITLIALFFAEENWRGKRAWDNYIRDSEARGVILDWKKIIPPEVPDDQNFAMTPFLKPILELNPDPLLPGQSRWRDTNGMSRIQNLASNFSRSVSNLGVSPKDQLINFEALLAYMDNPKLKKFDSSAPPKMTRKAAAAQFLAEMKEFDPVLDELQAASERPYSRFNVDYNAADTTGILLPHVAQLKKFSNIFSYKSCAELAVGESDKAFADLKTALKFQNAAELEPFLIESLVQIACSEIIIRKPVWEGLATHRWTDAQLGEIQKLLGNTSLLACNKNCFFFGERIGFGVRFYDFLRKNPSQLSGFNDINPEKHTTAFRFFPDGWLYLEQRNQQVFLDRYIDQQFSADLETIDPHAVTPQMMRELTNYSVPMDVLVRHDAFAKLTIPALIKSPSKAAFGQETVNLAIVACALERNRLAGNALPEKLDELVPRFVDKLPVDVIGGAPLKYKKVDDKHFLLYGIGWNDKDDGGVESISISKETGNPVQDKTQGDWVWPAYPEVAE